MLAWHTSCFSDIYGEGNFFSFIHYNDPKFSDRQVWANSVDPNQTALTLLNKESDQLESTLSLFAFLSASFGHKHIVKILGLL